MHESTTRWIDTYRALGDPYAILGVARTATAAEIRGARNRQMLKVHSDKHNLPDALRSDLDRMAAKVNKAAELLLDPKIRAQIDLDLAGGARTTSSTPPPPPSSEPSPSGDYDSPPPPSPATLRVEIAAEEARLKVLEGRVRSGRASAEEVRQREVARQRLDHLRRMLELVQAEERVRTAEDTSPDWADHPRSAHRVSAMPAVRRLLAERSRAAAAPALRAIGFWLAFDPNGMWALLLAAFALAHFVVAASVGEKITIGPGWGISYGYLLILPVLAFQHWLAGRRCHKPTTAIWSWAQLPIVIGLFAFGIGVDRPKLAIAGAVILLALLAGIFLGFEGMAAVLGASVLLAILAGKSAEVPGGKTDTSPTTATPSGK